MRRWLLVACTVHLLAVVGSADIAKTLTYPVFKAWDPSSNLPLVGGLLYSYAAGTSYSVTQELYQDAQCTTPHPNPITLDANGEAVIYASGVYDLVLKKPDGTQLWAVQNVKHPTFSTFIDQLLDDGSAAEARSTLGLATSSTLAVGTDPGNLVQLDNAGKLPAVDGSNLLNISGTRAAPRGYIDGMRLQKSPTQGYTLIVHPGVARDSSDATDISISAALYKRVDTVFEEGGTATASKGGMESAPAVADTWYHVFAITGDGKTPDVVISSSTDSPTLPTGFSYSRRIGSIRTDADAFILDFWQYGDYFRWARPYLGASGQLTAQAGETARGASDTITLSYVPSGLDRTLVVANIAVAATNDNDYAPSIYVAYPDDTAPVLYAAGSPALSWLDLSGSGYSLAQFDNASSKKGIGGQALFQVDENQQVDIHVEGYNASTNLNLRYAIWPLGWFDLRGKDSD